MLSTLRAKVVGVLLGVLLGCLALSLWQNWRVDRKLTQVKSQLQSVQAERDSAQLSLEQLSQQRLVDQQAVSTTTTQQVKAAVQYLTIKEKVREDVHLVHRSTPTVSMEPVADPVVDAVSRVVINGMWDAYRVAVPHGSVGTSPGPTP